MISFNAISILVTNLSPSKKPSFSLAKTVYDDWCLLRHHSSLISFDWILDTVIHRYSHVINRFATKQFLHIEPGHKSQIDYRYIHQIKSIEIQRIISTMVSSVKSLLTNLLVAIALLTSSPLFPSVGMYEMSVDVCGGQTDFTPSLTFVF